MFMVFGDVKYIVLGKFMVEGDVFLVFYFFVVGVIKGGMVCVIGIG